MQHKLDEFLLANLVPPCHYREDSRPFDVRQEFVIEIKSAKTRRRKDGESKADGGYNPTYHTYVNGDTVMARNYRPGLQWMTGQSIVEVTGPVSFKPKSIRAGTWALRAVCSRTSCSPVDGLLSLLPLCTLVISCPIVSGLSLRFCLSPVSRR